MDLTRDLGPPRSKTPASQTLPRLPDWAPVGPAFASAHIPFRRTDLADDDTRRPHASYPILRRSRTFESNARTRQAVCRLVRDYEQRIDVSEAMIYVAMGGLILRRISH